MMGASQGFTRRRARPCLSWRIGHPRAIRRAVSCLCGLFARLAAQTPRDAARGLPYQLLGSPPARSARRHPEPALPKKFAEPANMVQNTTRRRLADCVSIFPNGKDEGGSVKFERASLLGRSIE